MINHNWDQLLQTEYEKEYFKKLIAFIDFEYQNYSVLPKREDLFTALKITTYEQVKVVILGQDPYHNLNQAHGIGFSVRENVKIPPSLVNIFKELESDLGIPSAKSGDLTKWAKQGVLLLNAVLTVRENTPTSHQKKGWEQFTDAILSLINQKTSPVVYLLWGSYAKQKINILTNPKHLIIEGLHPSPLSAYRGFFGGKYFSKTNQFLIEQKLEPIDWDLSKP